MSNLGQPVRIKYIPSIAFLASRHTSIQDRPLKPPSRNCAKALEKRNPVLKARRVKALDRKRHERNIYDKITDWSTKIEAVLHDSIILAENVYNMDATGVMLSKLGSAKVLVEGCEAVGIPRLSACIALHLMHVTDQRGGCIRSVLHRNRVGADSSPLQALCRCQWD
jgi:hypothetical protein